MTVGPGWLTGTANEVDDRVAKNCGGTLRAKFLCTTPHRLNCKDAVLMFS